MKGLTKKYLKKIEELSISGKLPFRHLAKAFEVSREEPEKHKIIRDRLIGNYLKSVGTAAKRISKATHLDLDELIQEGNLSVCEYFSNKKQLPKSFNTGLISNINSRLKTFALEQILENLRKEKLSPDLIGNKQYFTEDLTEEIFQYIDKRAKGMLNKNQYVVFSSRHHMYGEPASLEEVGKKVNLSRARAGQIYIRACKILQRYAKIPLIEKAPKKYKLKKPAYSPEIIEKLGQDLRKKQGIGLADLSAALNFNPGNLASFVRKGYGIRLNKSQKKDIFKEYCGEKEKRVQLSKEEIRERSETLYNQITSYLGFHPQEFIAYFNMSEEDFIRFIRERFPGLKDKYVRKVITLDKKEIEKKDFPKEDAEISELAILDRVLHLLEYDKYNKYFPNLFSRVTERLKHAMFPVYINDTNQCLGLLEKKIEEYKDNPAVKYFKQVYDFFDRGLSFQPERLKTKLDDFQKIDTLTLVDKGRHILASETGVGKSLEIIAAAESLPVEKVLILTNKTSTMATWEKEIKKHLGDETVVITGDVLDKKPLFRKAEKSKWVVCNYETYHRLLEQFKVLNPDMVVIDEADVMNNPSSQRTKAILNTNAKYKYCVSGWIYKNRRMELWPILNWLYPEEYPFRDQFARDYCTGEWGRLRLKYELSHKLIYRPKSLVLPGLPEFNLNTIDIDMNPRQKQEYLKAETNFVEWYKQKTKKRIPSGIAITKLHSLRRIALKPKFSELYKRLSERHKIKNKTVIFCSYIDEARQIADKMSKKFQVGYFDGQTKADDRQDIIERFNNTPKPELLVMSEAGGKSIELIAADYLYLFNPVWTYNLKKQIIDRLHRRGQKRNVEVYEFITKNTLEENIYNRTEQKREDYEKTVIDSLGYTSWFEENQENVINLIIKDIVNKGK